MLYRCILCLSIDVRYEKLHVTHVIASLNLSLDLLFYLRSLYRNVRSVLVTKFNKILGKKLNIKKCWLFEKMLKCNITE
jgi:hypothetical protein